MNKRIIAVYAGRFQPFHKGHYSVYQHLVDKFGKDNVYIGTSAVTDPERSPLDFSEKKSVMTKMFGIPADKIQHIRNPYAPTEILQNYDPKNTSFVTAVSQKDAERLGGKYFNTFDDERTGDMKGYDEAGYVVITPELKIDVGGHNISGTTIRTAMRDPDRSDEDKKKLFKMLYGKFDPEIYTTITTKFASTQKAEKPIRKRTPISPNARVKNPVTRRDILVKTALKYPNDHPAHKAAAKLAGLKEILHIRPIVETLQAIHEIANAEDRMDILNRLEEQAIQHNERKALLLIREAKSSTERVRKYYRKHPKKVRQYLKKTQDERVARNRDRRKAVKKHGKSKMKNHDVHHPNGPNGGSWRLAKKDHGPDKKHESIDTEGALLLEGGAAGHMMHPFEDTSLTFADLKNMIQMGLVGSLSKEGPATEKLDGQNIAFTVKDGEVRFARNTGHVKNKGETSLSVDQLKQKFAGRGELSDTFGDAADDLQQAISTMSPDEIEKIFADGSRFASVEIINPSTENIIPYNKMVLVIHNITDYDENGDELGRSLEAGKYLADKITEAGADTQKKYGIKGPAIITLNDFDIEDNIKKAERYERMIDHYKDRYRLSDDDTVGTYHEAWWEDEIDKVSRKTGVDLSSYRDGLVQRWGFDNKKLQLASIKDPAVRKVVKDFEKDHLANARQKVRKPFERIFLKAGSDALKRTSNLLAANNPRAGTVIKKKVAEVLKQLRETDDAKQVDFLDRQIRRLGSIGFDNIVPSEGIVFTYNGHPYKFTGTFAPVNALVGTFKFGRTSKEPANGVETSIDRELIGPLLRQRIRNPVTQRDIYIGSALGYNHDHPAYKAAKQFVQRQIQQKG